MGGLCEGCLEVCATGFRLNFLLCAFCHHLSGRIGLASSAKTGTHTEVISQTELIGTAEAERGTDESVQEFWVFAGDVGG